MSELADIEKLIVAKGNDIRDLKASKADKATITPHVQELLELKTRYKALNGGVEYGKAPAAPVNPELAEIEKLIVAKGEEIRDLKANKADKEAIAPHIADLLALKERYQAANNGVAYAAPSSGNDKKEKKKGPAQEAPAREGPSKKELNKLKKKEKKAAYSEGKAPDEGAAPAPLPVPVAAAVAPKPVASASPVVTGSCGITFHPQSAPAVTRTVMALLGVSIPVTESAAGTPEHPPFLHSPAACGGLGASVSGDYTIARFLCREHGPQLLHPVAPSDTAAMSWCASEVDQWIDHCIAAETTGADTSVTVAVLDAHLAMKTFLAGSTLSLADIAVYNLVVKRGRTFPQNVQRWATLVGSLLPRAGTAAVQKKGGKGGGA
mmetsp:Transcript_36891/g.80345  ORF Transcript_36891/g.80345 Transcript_36891/m.80345 type:complete len:379 (-) Transcript_36891:1-1137(-)